MIVDDLRETTVKRNNSGDAPAQTASLTVGYKSARTLATLERLSSLSTLVAAVAAL